MKNLKKALVCTAAIGATVLATATPVVSDVTMTQSDASRLVTITYRLTEDAVVTLDVMTNATPNAATGWASIGGEAICNAEGAVWRKVTSVDADGNGNYTIKWRPDLSWTDEFGKGFKIADGCAKAVVTAWALDNTPDYMVVDLTATGGADTQRYYTSTNFLPGGLFGNPDYRTTSLVMRKIMAKDVTWTMGSTVLESKRNAQLEATHQVTFTNNYYIGVFPVTQAQWSMVGPYRPEPARFNNATDRSMRAVESVSYNEIRNSENKNAVAAYDWPANPNPDSFLGKLRSKTSIDFDLPSEAQWEFAARAGNGATKWGCGAGIQNEPEDENMNRFGRYERNGGKLPDYSIPADSCEAANATAIVGSYIPNSWGLYDVAGNVWEWCLDWFEADITARNGAVNVDPTTPANTLSGASGEFHVLRGGSWATNASYCRPAYRLYGYPADTRNYEIGLRVVCTAGLR